MSDKKQQQLTAKLTERVQFLVSQLDKTVLIEKALEATLTELVPGFGPRFAEECKKAEKEQSLLDIAALHKLAAEIFVPKTKKVQ
jgi:hypothetical protein